MAEEVKPSAESPAENAGIITKQEHVEVLDSKGNNLNSTTGSNLADIFEKVESGRPVSEAVKETMTKTKKEVTEEKKQEVVEKNKEESQKSDLEKKLEPTQAEKNTPAEEEISRDSLRKKTEEKKAEPEEPKKQDKIVDPDEPSEDELQVLPHDKPKTAKRIQTLIKKVSEANETVTRTKKEAEEKAAKLKELEDQLKAVKTVDPKTDEAVKQQLDELAMYRRRYALEKDPSVKARFDDRINSAEKAIPDILKKNGAGEGLLKLIEEEGGWSKFAASGRPVGLADGTKVSAAELADKIVSSLPIVDRKAVDVAMMEKIQVSREKDRFFEEETKQANDFFKKQEEQEKKRGEDYQKNVSEAQKAIEDWNKEVAKSEFLTEKPVPTDATPEQKATIEEDNRYTKQLQSLLKKSSQAKTLPDMLDIVLDSVKYYDERRKTQKLAAETEKLRKELKQKQEEIDKFKGASRTVRPGSISGGGVKESEKQSEKKPRSLEEQFDLIAAGKSAEE